MEKKNLAGLKVLVVDDEQVIREILRSELEHEKFIIDEACDGEQALQMLLENHFDFIRHTFL